MKTIDDLHEALREDVARLQFHGVTVQVATSQHVPTDRGGHRYVYLTKPYHPGIVIMQIGDFPRLGQPNTLSIPVKPNREYGSSILLDVEPGSTLVETVLRALERDTVMPRFANWQGGPVPVDQDPAPRFTLETVAVSH